MVVTVATPTVVVAAATDAEIPIGVVVVEPARTMGLDCLSRNPTTRTLFLQYGAEEIRMASEQ